MPDIIKNNFNQIWDEMIEEILGEVEDVDKDIIDFNEIRDRFYNDCKTLFGEDYKN